ncbi:lipopolysaccharide export system protein LptC [Halopseudomonas xinjiangensis]|uniref:Lipopolysaccharide export system protein LptC n=1 Tax=Halopseudomonas xinjiangensis TaxID=487184 RepID=A0A1H1VMM4_9GAMM|nr:LPS export ABC transporter periplasmic protein LptC [Halopseudomonas xinjiangensis]SDS86052.1 lipopolysaccharide export system protein LptC [Halopseudomonas xinjiangensis]
MIIKLPRYVVLAIVVGTGVLAALAMGYWNIRPASFQPDPLVIDPRQPDFFMENARIRKLNVEGTVSYELTTERATHLASDESTLLEEPYLVFFRKGEPQPWELRARHGQADAGGDRVRLTEEVELQQKLPDRALTQLTTSLLDVYPQRDYAETDQPVRIEAANGVTTAVGMQVQFNDGTMTLLSNVRGEHEVR